MSPERLREWAAEHLMYEVETLVFVVLELGKELGGMLTNALLESFVVHARCLSEFLWHDRREQNPKDAFASDFCRSGEWEKARGPLPRAALEDVRDRQRFGREVMHLTYQRIDGAGEEKEWPCGEVLMEIATALEKLAEVALIDRLGARTQASLSTLRLSLDEGQIEEALNVRAIRAGGY